MPAHRFPKLAALVAARDAAELKHKRAVSERDMLTETLQEIDADLIERASTFPSLALDSVAFKKAVEEREAENDRRKTIAEHLVPRAAQNLCDAEQELEDAVQAVRDWLGHAATWKLADIDQKVIEAYDALQLALANFYEARGPMRPFIVGAKPASLSKALSISPLQYMSKELRRNFLANLQSLSSNTNYTTIDQRYVEHCRAGNRDEYAGWEPDTIS